MTLNEKLETLRGQSYEQILATLAAEKIQVLGKLQGTQLKRLQSFIGATGLRERLAKATLEQAAAASSIAEAIQPAYLAAEDTYSINLADPQVANLLQGAVTVGLIAQAEANYLQSLATYETSKWPSVTIHDLVSYFEPTKVLVGEWAEVLVENKRQVMLNLLEAVPEPTYVRLEMRESHDGVHWTNWNRIAPFVGVHTPGVYYQAIPYNGRTRQLRWRGENYLIQGTVEAV